MFNKLINNVYFYSNKLNVRYLTPIASSAAILKAHYQKNNAFTKNVKEVVITLKEMAKKSDKAAQMYESLNNILSSLEAVQSNAKMDIVGKPKSKLAKKEVIEKTVVPLKSKYNLRGDKPTVVKNSLKEKKSFIEEADDSPKAKYNLRGSKSTPENSSKKKHKTDDLPKSKNNLRRGKTTVIEKTNENSFRYNLRRKE